MLPAILICAFMVKYAATQTVTASLGTTKSCVVEGDDVKLLCTVFSGSGCCNSSTRIWQKVGAVTSLLSDGVSSNPSKYVEDYEGVGAAGFNLIIRNMQTSDFGVTYKCQYGLTPSKKLYLNNILCNCWICAGTDFGYSFLGDVIGTVIILIITKVKIGDIQSVLRVGLLFIIDEVVNIIVALPIGYLKCHCVDGTGPWLILLGLVMSVITGGIPLIYRLYHGEDADFWVECFCKVQTTLCVASLLIGSSQGSNGSSCWPPCKVEQEPKNPKKPSSNEQPLKENEKKKPAAKKSSNEPPLEKKKKKKPAAGKGSRSPPSAAKHIKTANNETEMIPTEKGFSGDLEKKIPLPPLTNQPSPTNRPLPLPSSTRPLPSSTRPLPQITTNKGDN